MANRGTRFCSLIAVLLLLDRGALPARAVDGFLLSVHYDSATLGPNQLGNIHDAATPGKLVRHDLKDDRVVASKVLYENDGVATVCLSPLGDRVAITKPSGMIAVLSVDGGVEAELVNFRGDEKPKADQPSYTALQWPASEGAQWIYYLDGRNGGANNSLRRVNVSTRQDELVVKLNRGASGGFALTPDATPRFGKFVKRTDNYVIAIYDLASGDGDLFNCPRTGGCGESVSPDGGLLTANSGAHTSVALVDMAGNRQHEFRLSQWAGDPCRGVPREQLEWAWQSFRWSTNALNWISVTQGKLKLGSTHEIYFADAMLYDWIAERQLNVTQNTPGSFDRAGGFWETGSKTALLGYFSGKAPLSVEFHDPRLTDAANWDFGDGSAAATGRSVRHTFEKDGTYTARATQGDQTFQAQINVQRRLAPRGTCHFVSDTRLLVEFSEAVQAAEASAKLASGLPVVKAYLNQTGRRMLVELGSPLTKNDKLSIAGVTDFAQQPNALDAKPIDVVVPAWPSNRSDLVFLWDTSKTLNAVYNSENNTIRELRVSRDAGGAGIDRYGRMQFSGGRMSTGFYSQSGAQEQFRELVLADAFSLEVLLQSSDLAQQKPEFPARIVNCSAWHDGDWEFFLGQQKDRLVASIRTTDNMLSLQGKPIKGDLHGRAPIFEIARLPDTAPHHLILSYAAGRMVAYLDGQQVFETKEVTGSLKAWGYGELCFGDNHNGGRQAWLGRLEGVAIYKRFIDAAEARRNAALALERIKARHSLPQLELEAKLVAVSKIPTLAQIAPYRDALVVNEFVIGKVLKRDAEWNAAGHFEPGQKLRVAQWGLVDGIATSLGQAKLGDGRRLALEAYDNHPEKLDELEMSNSLDEDFDLPLLYEPQP
jgi:hypothetical protein